MNDMISRSVFVVLTATLMLALTGCGEPGPTQPGETGVSGSELTFLHFASEASSGDSDDINTSTAWQTGSDGVTLLTTDTSFVATRGEPLSVELFYVSDDDSGAAKRFLEFELDAGSLASYPPDHPRAGDAFLPGDTITISIRVATDTLMAKLAPGGLKFDPDAPAKLEISYGSADFDPADEEEIDLWKQESVGEPWFRVGEIQNLELDTVEATLRSFTRYAMAI